MLLKQRAVQSEDLTTLYYHRTLFTNTQ